MKSETNALKVSIIKTADPVKEKSFLLLLPAGKRHLRHTLVCKRGRQALVPAGLIKVSLFTELPFLKSQKIGRLALCRTAFILELHFAETQVFSFQSAKLKRCKALIIQ